MHILKRMQEQISQYRLLVVLVFLFCVILLIHGLLKRISSPVRNIYMHTNNSRLALVICTKPSTFHEETLLGWLMKAKIPQRVQIYAPIKPTTSLPIMPLQNLQYCWSEVALLITWTLNLVEDWDEKILEAFGDQYLATRKFCGSHYVQGSRKIEANWSSFNESPAPPLLHDLSKDNVYTIPDYRLIVTTPKILAPIICHYFENFWFGAYFWSLSGTQCLKLKTTIAVDTAINVGSQTYIYIDAQSHSIMLTGSLSKKNMNEAILHTLLMNRDVFDKLAVVLPEHRKVLE